MEKLGESIEVVESKSTESKRPIILEGFPDVGLVGSIATSHLVNALDFEQIGYVESEYFPPMVTVRKGSMYEPVGIFYGNNVYVVTSELPVPVAGVYRIMSKIANWMKSKNPSVIISLGGIAEPERVKLDEPSVFAVPNGKGAAEVLKGLRGIELLNEGFLVGPKAMLLKECRKIGAPAIGLFAQAYYKFPDPGAAAKVLTVLSAFENMRVDIGPLAESAEKLRVQYRDLMRRTEEEMNRMEKSRELEFPGLLV
ncbi:MAG: proteasome assembly chaperone family protein [Candidatus Brockarchaeota archaeon]|nr:proteasome assembly chaperone family protein [Candidatus Brockarchaeota archaeon]